MIDSRGHKTLIDRLMFHVKHHPNKTAYTFLEDGKSKEKSWTYQMLSDRVDILSSKLLSLTSPGDRVILMYETGLEFIAALLGPVNTNN